MSHSKPVHKNIYFMGSSPEMEQFENELAYFYDAPHPESIANHYLHALKQFESLGPQTNEQDLETHMLPSLIHAYSEVLNQTHRQFDVKKAAKLELSLIVSQARKSPFDVMNDILLQLYQEVFRTDIFALQKAAMIRTFLYQYKIKVLQNENHLTKNDKEMMLLLAKRSQEALQKIHSKQ